MKTYGSVIFDCSARKWRVECLPHVSMRFKRVFGSQDARTPGRFTLSDTADNARDLKWFMSRYPLEILDGAGEHLQKRNSEFHERAALVEILLSRKFDVPQYQMEVEPRHYQREATALVLSTKSLLLADQVGLGKTITAISMFTRPDTLPALVVTLTHLPLQWHREISRCLPGLCVHILKKASPYDLTRTSSRSRQSHLDDRMPDVIISNYHKLDGWAQTLVDGGLVKTVIYDECQELRKSTSMKYAAAEYISNSVEYRMGLSATPFMNYGGELYNVMQCIAPGRLGSREEFANEWTNGATSDDASIANPKAFGLYLREAGLILRRTRAEVGRELPNEPHSIPHYIESDTKALQECSRGCRELAQRLLSRDAQSFRGEKMMVAQELSNRLRQATGIGKAPYVAQFVRMLVENGEKVVLYGWHHAVYSIWVDLLKDLKPAKFTGTESVPQKEEAKRRFISAETPLLIMSLRAGAGLDGLQFVSNTVVFGELDWSPGIHEQAIGRVARDGQKNQVWAYYLLSESGADPVMSEVLGLKDQQIQGVNNPEADMIEKLEVDEDHVRRLAEDFLKRIGA